MNTTSKASWIIPTAFTIQSYQIRQHPNQFCAFRRTGNLWNWISSIINTVGKRDAVFNVGFAFSSTRTSALDPALCPQNKGQSDLYTKAFLSQFCTDSQSDAAVAQGKKQNYLGTFKDTDITLPDMESLYISKKFYIPNANVQDLN